MPASTKKRTIADSLEPDEGSMAAISSTTAPRRKKQGFHSPGSTVKRRDERALKLREEHTSFLKDKMCLWQQHMESLNENTKAQVLKTRDPDEALMTVCNYLDSEHTVSQLYHRQEGNVVAMGMDDAFQLGVSSSSEEDKKDEYPPTMVLNIPNNIIQVATGGMHSVAVSNDGVVYTWGCNDDYALGRADIEERDSHMVNAITTGFEEDQNQIIAVDAGDSHSLFLSLKGNVYMCGMYKDMDSGKFTNLKPGEVLKKGAQQKYPVKVSMPLPVRKIAAGFSWNAALLQDDSLVTWGMGHFGELARSETMGAKKEKDPETGRETYNVGKLFIGEEYTVQVWNEKEKKHEDDRRYRYHLDLIADKFLTPSPVCWATPAKKKVLNMACGELFLLVVAQEFGRGKRIVYSSGHNQYGQLGHGDQIQRHELTPVKFFDGKEITQVAAGANHSLALNVLGDAVFAWGRGDYGQLGLYKEKQDPGSFESTPKQVAFPKRPDGSQEPRIVEVTAGERISMARLETNEIYTWGFNESGFTGHRSNTDGQSDVERPKLLNTMRKIAPKNSSDPAPKGRNAHVLNAAGGGQHTLMVIQRFS